jgi:hypothetical protein
MDIGLAAAMVALVRGSDVTQFEGAAMFSALPDAPVVEARRRGRSRASSTSESHAGLPDRLDRRTEQVGYRGILAAWRRKMISADVVSGSPNAH